MLKRTRNQFLEFFKSKDHLIIDSFPVKPINDPSILFINAGMAPMKKYFLGKEIPLNESIANSQQCIRAGGKHNDLGDVGYTKRHHTFFEMLGNFSFGSYFKKEAIAYSWEFLTQIIKVDKSRLYVTVHPDDIDAYNFWKEHIDEERIHKLKENVWKMGEYGPFGHCCEIFYDMQTGSGDFIEGDRYLEVWNIVFMSHLKDEKGERKLEKACIDAGMGLERLVSVIEGVDDNYDISFFKDVLHFLNQEKNSVDTKIFLDHLRTIAFLTTEGVRPGANGREYVMRRIVRRALKSFFKFNVDLKEVIFGILNEWQKSYEFKIDIEKTFKVFNEEKNQFEKMLIVGMKKFEAFLEESNHFDAKTLFLLHDTYGFSIDISIDLLKEKNCTYDLQGFEKLMEESKNTNKKEAKSHILPYQETKFIDAYELEANVLGIKDDYIILDQTPFYACAGGQVGDHGVFITNSRSIKIIDTIKSGEIILHKCERIPKDLPSTVVARIDFKRRMETRKHHSAAHILHKVLKDMFGDDLNQKGSLVSCDKFRLDFSYAKTLSQKELIEIESKVNEFIQKSFESHIEEVTYQEAIEKGAIALFDYAGDVRVVSMGDSCELCCGSHVENTGEIGVFKIVKCSAVSAGIKRIEAVVGKAGVKKMQQESNILKELQLKLSVGEDALVKKITELTSKKETVITTLKKQKIADYSFGMCTGKVDIENYMKKNNLDVLCECVFVEQKVSMRLKTNINLDAKKVMSEFGFFIQAHGIGGRSDFAQTGGVAKSVDEIFEKLVQVIKNNI